MRSRIDLNDPRTRFLIQALFLVLVAVCAARLHLARPLILLVMLAAWALTAVLEKKSHDRAHAAVERPSRPAVTGSPRRFSLPTLSLPSLPSLPSLSFLRRGTAAAEAEQAVDDSHRASGLLGAYVSSDAEPAVAEAEAVTTVVAPAAPAQEPAGRDPQLVERERDLAERERLLAGVEQKAAERERELDAERELMNSELAAERERLAAEAQSERERLAAAAAAELAAERELMNSELAAERERLAAEAEAQAEQLAAEQTLAEADSSAERERTPQAEPEVPVKSKRRSLFRRRRDRASKPQAPIEVVEVEAAEPVLEVDVVEPVEPLEALAPIISESTIADAAPVLAPVAYPSVWNLYQLEEVARREEDPYRVEELGFMLMYLREHAQPDGNLPESFDSMLRDSFGHLFV